MWNKKCVLKKTGKIENWLETPAKKRYSIISFYKNKNGPLVISFPPKNPGRTVKNLAGLILPPSFSGRGSAEPKEIEKKIFKKKYAFSPTDDFSEEIFF